MVNKNRMLFTVACLIFLTACRTRIASKAEYIRFVEDTKHGFRKERTVDHWQYSVQLKPATYIFLHEQKDIGEEANYKSRINQLKDWYFFNIYVQHDSIKKFAPVHLISTDLEAYNTNLSYYLRDNKNNFILFADTIALYPIIYNYENDYNLSPEDVFVVGFKVPEALVNKMPEKLVLQYDDELLKNAMVRFVFNREDLEKEPVLTFNQLTHE